MVVPLLSFMIVSISLAQVAPPTARPAGDRPNLGVQPLPLHPGQKPEGVLINFVFPGSAAEAMGFRTGDEVLELNGIGVPDVSFLVRELGRENIGAKVSFRIRRGAESLELKGPMGSYLKTSRTFLDHCRRELVGKPFRVESEVLWPDGRNGLEALRGKIGLVVAFNGNCPECLEKVWRKASDVGQRLERLGSGKDWFGVAAIYSNPSEKLEKNLEGRQKAIALHAATFPLGVARYPQDRIPLGSHGRDPLIQVNGVALLDPQGKLLFLDLNHPDLETPTGGFFTALQEAVQKHGPKGKAGGPPGASAAPSKS